MAEKLCRVCGLRKELQNFYRQRHMADGHLNLCKDCHKKNVRKNRSENLDRCRDYDRKRSLQPHRMEKNRTAAREKYNALRPPVVRDPLKYAAQTALGNAVRDGRIIKPDVCEACGEPRRLHGHHDDYSKPFDVQWLCAICHGLVHRAINDARRLAMRSAAEAHQ